MISPAISRLLAVTLLLVVLWAGGAAILALTDMIAVDAGRIAQAKARIAAAAEAQAEIPELDRRLVAVHARALDQQLLEGDSATAAQPLLQRRIEDMASELGVQSPAIGSIAAIPVGAFERIGISLQVQMTLPVLQALLYRLESASPALFVPSLSIQAPDNGGVPDPDAARERDLTVDMEIHGYIRSSRPGPA